MDCPGFSPAAEGVLSVSIAADTRVSHPFLLPLHVLQALCHCTAEESSRTPAF